MVNLSTKERMLLEDEKSHEQLCVDKYNEYSNKAHCPELKKLIFSTCSKRTTTSRLYQSITKWNSSKYKSTIRRPTK